MQINRFSCFANALTMLALSIVSASAQAILPQTIPLQQGWNLIQFQVTPTNPSPAAVFGGTNGFKAIWYYDSLSALWQVYQKPQGTVAQQTDQGLLNNFLPMGNLEPGKAYWVYMNAANTAFSVSGAPPSGTTFPSQNLVSGWNMVGFPIGTTSIPNNESISLLAVLTAAGLDYDAILTWEGGQYRKMFHYEEADPSTGNPGSIPGLPADATVDAPFPNLRADLGYLLHVKDPAVLRPVASITTSPDIDVEPKGNYPSREDLRRSPSNTPKGAREQTHITLAPGEDTEMISISNSGGGIMLWKATWTPSPGMPTGDWITLATSKTAPLPFTQQPNVLEGVTTVENDPIFLRLDRKNLTQGTYTGSLEIQTSVASQAKTYLVTVHVPGLGGEWSGWAIVNTVNGKRNKVPDIDLNISFSEDPTTPGLLRGALDSSRSLLWPIDVQLIGNITSSASNRFVLGGTMVLPPGDQNNQPYDKFKGDALLDNLGKPTNDVDWNDNGIVDAINPLPYPIQRTMLIDGRLTKASPVNEQGYEITGSYREIVYGMLADPIIMEGTFKITRDSDRPFASRRTAISGNSADSGSESVVTKENTGSVSIPNNSTATRVISISTDMQLADLSTSFNLSGLNNSNVIITLSSPDDASTVTNESRTLILQNNPAVNKAYLATPIYPDNLSPTDPAKSLSDYIKEVLRTKGNWSLAVQNNTGSPVTISGFRLTLIGQPVQDVYVKVQTPGGIGVESTLSLSGSPVGLIQPTLADGTAVLRRMPVGPLNFSASIPGLEGIAPVINPSQTTPMLGISPDNAEEARLQSRLSKLALPSVAVTPLPGSPITTNIPGSNALNPLIITVSPPVGPPAIYAGPTEGFVPLTVQFSKVNAGTNPVVKLKNLASGVATTVVSTDVEVVIAAPGSYSLILESPSGVVADEVGPIVALQSPYHTISNPSVADPAVVGKLNQTMWLFQTGLHGGGAIRETDITLADGGSPTNFSGAVFADLTAPQHTYAASADLDLAPFTTNNGSFYTDTFTAGFASYLNNTANRQTISQGLGWKDEDHNYTLPLGRWYDPISHNDIVDGISQLDQNDDEYQASPRSTGETTPYSHYRMTCAIGCTIMPAPPAAEFIYPVNRDYILPSDQPATYGLIPVHPEIPNRPDSRLPESGFAASRLMLADRLTPTVVTLRDAYLLTGPLVQDWRSPAAVAP